MLADSSNTFAASGRLDPELHQQSTVKLRIIEFIATELPYWRDHPDRPREMSETKLTEQLCEYLNGAARKSWDLNHIQFRTETTDEVFGGRKIDLSVKPLASTFIIEGRRHTQFDALFPIECKRLPTPQGTNRDKREYVITQYGTTGGIQRFKLGYHGAKHTFAAMIAYVQEQPCSFWLAEVNYWIRDLSLTGAAIWSDDDILQLLSDNLDSGVSALKSAHQRDGLPEKCEIHHLWIEMRDA